MTAIEKKVLQNGLCCGCDCTGFNAKLNYELDVTNKKVKVTDASEFGTDDDLKIVLIHVYDKHGLEKHGQINNASEDVEIDVEEFAIGNISITATVVSEKGCKADLGIYDLGGTALSGEIVNKANQGTRNLN